MNPEPLSTWATDPDDELHENIKDLEQWLACATDALTQCTLLLRENDRLSRELDSLKNTKHPAY